MEERENRKGPGVFYAVIGVATLVVAIIGATFAYFSVTLNSAADAVQGTTGQGTADKITLTVTKEAPTGANASGKLIPLNEATQMQTALTASCVDSNQNVVCQVYKVNVRNQGDNAVRLKGSMTLTSTAPNMKWKLIGANATTDANNTINGTSTAGEIVGNLLLPATNGTQDYYLVVWLHETGNQQDASAEAAAAENATVTAEANTSFTGQVTFNAIDANGGNLSGLTATFSSGS